jgi:hypothetical protein
MRGGLALLATIGAALSVAVLPTAALAASPPKVHIEPAEQTPTCFVLKATVNPEGSATSYYFIYKQASAVECEDLEGCGPETPHGGPLTGGTQQQVQAEVTGLEPNTAYVYWLIARNANPEAVRSQELTFTTPPAQPSIEWTNAWNLAPTDATLGAGIDPQGISDGAYYQFQLVKNASEYLPEMFCSEGGVAQPVGHGCGGNWGTPPEVIPLGGKVEGSKGQEVTLDLAGAGVTLTPGTTYHYRVLSAKALAEEEGGIFWEHPSVIAPDQTFTTPLSSAPSIESESTSSVTATGATLEANVNSEDLPEGAYYQFQVVKSTSEYLPELACPEPGLQLNSDDGCNSPDVFLKPTPGALPIGFIAKGAQGQSVSQSLAAAGITLAPGTTYHYRVLAAKRVQSEDTLNWEGPAVAGPDRTFTTPVAPVIDSVSLSNLTSSDATLEAQIDTEGLSTIYQFELRINLCPYSECIGYKDIPLPSGLLLGSFADQAVSLDLNSVGVSLAPGVYEYALSATSTGGHVVSPWQTLIPAVLDPPAPSASAQSGTGPPAGSDTSSGDQPAGSGGSPAPGVTPLGPKIVCLCNCTRGCHGKKVSPKLEPFENAQKLSKALKLCEKKPKSKRQSCKRQAEQQYSAAGKHRS